MHTGAYCDVSFDTDGKQVGFVGFPYSIDPSPYYQIKVPIARIQNGEGPSLLLMAGNHGDEYEGKITLLKAIRLIEAADIRGCITILPAANLPAVVAAKRCSPFDGGNLNRSFPGNPHGRPTERIAHYIEHELMPRHEVLFDIHSGGTSMDHLICSLVELSHDQARDAKAFELLRAMRVPYGFVADNGRDSPTSMAGALRSGCIGLSGEFGGGAANSPRTMKATALAVDNLMLAMGIISRRILTDAGEDNGTETQLIEQGPQSYFTYAEQRGWFEPAIGIGDMVQAGDVAGHLHDLERPLEPSLVMHFKESGLVTSLRLHTAVTVGDCLISLTRLAS